MIIYRRTDMKKHRYWLAAAALGGLAFVTIPAQARTNVDVQLSLGGGYYAPAYRDYGYVESTTYVYGRPRAYGRHYCPPQAHYYNGHRHRGYSNYRDSRWDRRDTRWHRRDDRRHDRWDRRDDRRHHRHDRWD
jgi:hypothetical protein